MSTRTDATYDDATTTSPRTDHATDDFSATPTSNSHANPADAPTPHGDVPWTQRCTRQFDTTDPTRMRNLNDDANAAMHDGV